MLLIGVACAGSVDERVVRSEEGEDQGDGGCEAQREEQSRGNGLALYLGLEWVRDEVEELLGGGGRLGGRRGGWRRISGQEELHDP